jgi:ferrous iron transport protein B
MSNIALIGLPNSGKSSLFNTLTKSRQRVANFPGITVEKRMGNVTYENSSFTLLDLPGVYTLDVSTLDEKVTRDYILNKNQDDSAEVFVLVVDSTNLKKSLYLALQIQELGQKFVLALNMMDVAEKRGFKFDLEKLKAEFACPIVPIVATEGRGIDKLVEAVLEVSKEPSQVVKTEATYQKDIKDSQYIKNKLERVETIMQTCISSKMTKDNFTEKLDNILLHPVWGVAILFAILIAVFQLLFVGADPFIGYIEGIFEWLGTLAVAYIPEGYLQSLVVDGILAGVGGILVFLPHIVFLFIIIYALEDFGYLGRAAFMLDYLMRRLGLPGKAVVPLLSSHACAIPGIMSARIIENPTERFITMMISPLTTCSARLPVYTLIIAAVIPNETIMGLSLPGLVLFALYAVGIISAFVVAFVMKKFMPNTSPSYLMMELPEYRKPKIKNILRGALQKGMVFVKKAGTVIFVLSMLIWVLVTFPKAPENAAEPAINYSYAAKIGKTFEPVFRPLGFDWRLTTALVPSFAAREVLVSSLATVMSVEAESEEAQEKGLRKLMAGEFTLATLLALLVWFIYSPQCISTFAVLKKETNSYKMPLIFGAYTLVLAYVMSFVTYLIFS